MRTARPSSGAVPPELAAEFVCPPAKDFDLKRESTETNTHYIVQQIDLRGVPDGTNNNRRIVLEYYKLRGSGKAPIILVLPMAGGGYAIEKHFAAYFANRGYGAAVVHREKIPKDQQTDRLIEDFNPMLRRMVLDHKRVIDWFETQPEADVGRLGIFGISLGGIKGALLTPLEERIRASVLGLAGGDLAHILVRSTESGLSKRREAYLKESNLTPDEAEVKLRQMLTRDPLNYARYVDPSRVMLVLARYDTVVPTETGLLLKERMGNPETIMLPSGHYTAALAIPYIQSQAFDFFAKHFDAETKSGKSSGVVQSKRR